MTKKYQMTEFDTNALAVPEQVSVAMAEIAAEMVHDVLTAFAARDPEAAREIVERDAKTLSMLVFDELEDVRPLLERLRQRVVVGRAHDGEVDTEPPRARPTQQVQRGAGGAGVPAGTGEAEGRRIRLCACVLREHHPDVSQRPARCGCAVPDRRVVGVRRELRRRVPRVREGGVGLALVADAEALMEEMLNKAAIAGKLNVPPREAARSILAANVGVTLMLISEPAEDRNLELSTMTRDSMISAISADHANAAAAEDSGKSSVVVAAIALNAALQASHSDQLSGSELRLFLEWLHRISSSSS